MDEALFERRQILADLAAARPQSCTRDLHITNPAWLPIRFAPFRYYTPRGEKELLNDNIPEIVKVIEELEYVETCEVDWDHLCLMVRFGDRFERAEISNAPIWSAVVPYEEDQNCRLLMSNEQFHCFTAKVKLAWCKLEAGFRRSVRNQKCYLVGRIGSPTAQFAHIPADTWENYKVISWKRGVARCLDTADTVFSLHVAESFGTYLREEPSEDRDSREGIAPDLADIKAILMKRTKLQRIIAYLYSAEFPPAPDIPITSDIRDKASDHINKKIGRKISTSVDYKQMRVAVKLYARLKAELGVQSLESIGIHPFPIEQGKGQP